MGIQQDFDPRDRNKGQRTPCRKNRRGQNGDRDKLSHHPDDRDRLRSILQKISPPFKRDREAAPVHFAESMRGVYSEVPKGFDAAV